jgi:hypothetical protein
VPQGGLESQERVLDQTMLQDSPHCETLITWLEGHAVGLLYLYQQTEHAYAPVLWDSLGACLFRQHPQDD